MEPWATPPFKSSVLTPLLHRYQRFIFENHTCILPVFSNIQFLNFSRIPPLQSIDMSDVPLSPTESPSVYSWKQSQDILEVLSSLSHRDGNLSQYLNGIAKGVSQLLKLDWSVVTICQNGQERVMASSLDLGTGNHIYSLHGSLTETVVKTGQTLMVDDAYAHPEYGEPPEGYTSYLGVPLRTAQGEVIGTICSFCMSPRPYSAEEVRTVELFAERAADAIDNHNLYQRVCKLNEGLEAEVIRRTEELRSAQARIIEQERLAAIGQFASMIVHEIRNPVTTMTMGLTHFKKSYTAERDQVRADLALAEAERLQRLLREILLFAKPQVLDAIALDFSTLIQDLLPTLEEMPEAAQRKLLYTAAPDGVVMGDRDKLKQVVINLVRNAYEAIAPGESVRCQITVNAHLGELNFSVHNGGNPIPPELLPKLTQPFCSTKSQGTGLGLAIVQRIIDAHQGTLTIQSTQESGTTFTVTLPLAKGDRPGCKAACD
jgi:signal transduction histidine kinase